MRSFALLLVSVLSVLATVAAKAQTPLTTAFTYQGELAATGTPAAGAFDLRFRLFDASTGGTQIGGTLCSDNLAVAGGRFLVSLDFGAAAFAGQGRFLEIEVRADTGLACANPAGFTILGPRQSISPTPYAIFATSASNGSHRDQCHERDQPGRAVGSFFSECKQPRLRHPAQPSPFRRLRQCALVLERE